MLEHELPPARSLRRRGGRGAAQPRKPAGWNHAIAIYQPEDLGAAGPYRESCGARLAAGEAVPADERISKYRSPRQCGRLAIYMGSYRYITGREGRVTDRRVPLCAVHAPAWAAKHGLELPVRQEA